jgi:cytochrome c peroxidase
LATFRSTAQCVHCHSGAEFTSASVSKVLSEGRLDHRLGANDIVFRYDNGFFNTGVRPTTDDIGLGGLDPFGNPLSETHLVQQGKQALLGNDFDLSKELPITADAPTAIDGAFKTPGLRNVELTGPYFHNGGKATLMQVVDFYNRGGDFTKENQPVPDPTIKPLGLTRVQKEELVAFLLALTDERVRFQRAPFDHPSICVPHGHEATAAGITVDAAGNAVDVMQCIAAVGASGSATPLQPFLQLDPFRR